MDIFDQLVDTRALRCALHVDTDPVDGAVRAALFTDDGRGNGDLVFSVRLAALRRFLEGELTLSEHEQATARGGRVVETPFLAVWRLVDAYLLGVGQPAATLGELNAATPNGFGTVAAIAQDVICDRMRAARDAREVAEARTG